MAIRISYPVCDVDPRVVLEIAEKVSTVPFEESEAVMGDELKQIFSLTDLTTLNPTDNRRNVGRIAEKVRYLQENVPLLPPLGGLCVPGDACGSAVEVLQESVVRVSTVVNFPLGHAPIESVLCEVGILLEQGVNEIDLVFPLNRYLAGDSEDNLIEFVSAVKAQCEEKNAYLKTIIQSDEIELAHDTNYTSAVEHIARLATICYAAGSDMVKTSTGKGGGAGASLMAAATMCHVAKHFRDHTSYQELIGHVPGIKYSGGIGDVETALRFMRLHQQILGQSVLCSEHFRFGASRLMRAVLARLLALDIQLSSQLKEAGINEEFFSESSKSQPSVPY